MASSPQPGAPEASTNVTVAVRCRPLNEREKTAARPAVVICKPNTNEIAIHKRKEYTFDKVYGQYSTQKDVFKATVKPVVDEALAGYNCTVFAYGQTGTGKTHTMQGSLEPDTEMAGIIPRAVRYIFDVLQANHQEYSVKVSFLQLYNEELKDLLAPSTTTKLRLMEDVKRGGIYCQNLLEVTTTTASHVFELLETGVKNRITSETLMNENSSRSHSIFTIRIHTKEGNPVGGEDLLRIGQLNLVDLAGSECIGRSGARNVRAREAGNINQSLLTLGRVITALVDNHPHIPYRDSKLTRLLQESLGGRAKTTIIATLAPCADSLDETLSTLEYAYRAKNIKNRPEVNQKMTKSGLLKEYGNEIESLRNALQAARAKDGIFLPPAQFSEMQERLASQTAQIAELEDELETRSTACKELEEQVDLQKEEITGLQREKVLIETTLQEREAELQTTKTTLAQTQHELAETQRLLQLFQSNEIVLLKSGSKATRLFRESEVRVDKLTDKIRRKQRVEDFNDELSNAFAGETQSQLQSFEERLAMHQERQLTMFADVDNAMSTLREAHTLDTSQLLNTLAQLEKAANDQHQKSLEDLEQERIATSEDKAAALEATKQRLEEAARRVEELAALAKTNAVSFVEELSASHAKQLSHLEDIASNVSKSRDEMSCFLQEQSHKLALLKGTLDASFEDQAQQLAKHKQSLVDALRDGQSQQKSHLEEMKSQLSSLIEQSIAAHAQRIDADVEMVTAHGDSHQANLKETQAIMNSEIDATTSGMDAAESLQQTQFTKFENRLLEAREDATKMHAKHQVDVDTQLKSQQQWSEEFTHAQNEQRQQFTSLLESQTAKTNDRIQARSAALQSFSQEHSAICDGLTKRSDELNANLDTHVQGVKRKFSQVSDSAKEIVKESSSTATQQREQVSGFIKKRRLDAPTGSTPVKASPAFPSFVPTSVDGVPFAAAEAYEEDDDEDVAVEHQVEAPQEDETHEAEQESPVASEDPEPAASPADDTPVCENGGNIPVPKQLSKIAAPRKRAPLSAPLQRPSGSSLMAPTKRFKLKKAPLSETTNKM